VNRLLLIAALAAAQFARGQSIEVYSEFRRIDPFGRVIGVDRGGAPREILSPMVARNAWAGFHVVVTPRGDQWFSLMVGLNPEDAVKIQVYREAFTKVGEEWVPDRLTSVTLPYQGRLPEEGGVPGQTVLVFWMEFRVAPDAPADFPTGSPRDPLRPRLRAGPARHRDARRGTAAVCAHSRPCHRAPSLP